MAIAAAVTRLLTPNEGYALTATAGTSQTAGTAEKFEFVFPCADERAYIIVENGGVAAVTARLESNSAHNGFVPQASSIAANEVFAFAIESGFVKNTDGKVVLKLTPSADKTLSASGVKVYALYHGVTAN